METPPNGENLEDHDTIDEAVQRESHEEKTYTPLTPEQRFGKVILKQNLMLNVQ